MTSVNVKKWPPNFVMRNARHKQSKYNFKNRSNCGNEEEYYRSSFKKNP